MPPIKTFELKVILTPQQKDKVDFWLSKANALWNIALKQCEIWEIYTGYYSKEGGHSLANRIFWEYRNYYLQTIDVVTAAGETKELEVIIDRPTKVQMATARKIAVPFCTILTEEVQKTYLKELPEAKIVGGKKRDGTDDLPLSQRWAKMESIHGSDFVWSCDRLSRFRGVAPRTGRFITAKCGKEFIETEPMTGFSCPIFPSFSSNPEGYPPGYYETYVKPHLDIVASWPQDVFYCHKPLIGSPSYKGLYPAVRNDSLEYRRDSEELQSVPSNYRKGIIYSLGNAWSEYDKSRKKKGTTFRGRPRYKTRSDKTTTLIDPNPSKERMVPSAENRNVLEGVSGLGDVLIPKLGKRWRNPDGTIPEISMFKICREPSGYYVHLSGEVVRSLRLRKQPVPVRSARPGIAEDNWLTFDNGEAIANPRYFQKAEADLRRLEQELAHKRIHRLILWLNHPERTSDHIKVACQNISEEDCLKLRQVKTEPEGIEIIGKSRWNRLKFNHQPDSQVMIKIKTKISKLHEKTRRQRSAYCHRLSTQSVRHTAMLYCQEGIQSEELKHKSEPKFDENEKFTTNGSQVQRQQSKRLTDAAHGKFMEQCGTKYKQADRHFERVPGKDAMRECPVCSTHNEVEVNAENYTCSVCHFTAPRAAKPAILLLVKKFMEGHVERHQLSSQVQRAISLREQWIARNGGSSKAQKTKGASNSPGKRENRSRKTKQPAP